jgi:S-layer protein
MAYTYDQLVQAYTAAHDGVGPDAATKANFQVQAVQSANGQQTDAQLLSNIVNSADNSTGLAVMAYQFFTGKSPTKAGIDYLVNSPTNNNDLNDAYYAKFGLENRYINFAGNLGVQGEGAANFSAKYGALSFADYVASIYQTIIGASYATAAGIDPAKAIADIISRKDAILATAQGAGMIPANATQAQIDIALKAATAGYLLGEAIKADVGLYAAATDNFMVAVAQGTATYNTDITLSYQPGVNTPAHGAGHTLDNAPPVLPTPTPPVTTQPADPSGPPPVAHAFALTAGNDTFTGQSLADTFTATDTTLNAGDILNGGGGADTLTITAATGATYAPAAATITNIETISVTNNNRVIYDISGLTDVTQLTVNSVNRANVTAASTTNVTVNTTAQAAGVVEVRGGKDVSVTTTGNTGGVTSIGAVTPSTGVITLSSTSTGAVTAGAITVDGGTTVNITQAATNANNTTQTNGAVTVYGESATTSVTVHSAAPAAANLGIPGVNAASVTINDVTGAGSSSVGTITTVNIDSYTTLAITDNALSNLTVAHGSGNISIDNSSALTPNPATTLNLSLNAVTGGTLSDTGVYTTLNVTTGANSSTLANIAAAALTTLNVSGATTLTLTSTAGATALHTVTVTGEASLSATLGAGADTINLGAGPNIINTGAGADVVNITAANVGSNLIFSTLGVSAGDKLGIAAQGGAAAFTGTMGAIGTGTTFQSYLDAAAAGDGHVTSHWSYFQISGETFVVLDNSASATFQAGTDIVVRLVGAFAETGATITAGVLTIQ